MKQFENLTATHLFCSKCREATPVQERLLLVLPDGGMHDYLCTQCGNSLGTRRETNKEG